jgi:asparagine N-glycosylation enzyme membrane subunit Stt3
VLHAAAGGGHQPQHPGGLPVSTVLIIALLLTGVVVFGLLFVLLALVLYGTWLAAAVVGAFLVGSGLLVRHIGDVLRDN